jgi:serine/threonine protein kinase
LVFGPTVDTGREKEELSAEGRLMSLADQAEDAGPAARVGTVIKGKWTLDALLGVGGMAAVYAATHRNNTRAALKILHVDFAREKTICERFLREAYVSNKVSHPATVQVLDDDVTEQDEPYLIMELLEGETVRDAWKKAGRAMPAVQVLQICEAVLDCLSACHAIGVIHRDLKPANIFLTNDGVVKVLDFGVAQMRSATKERTATGTALGTPAYMSPEQAMGLVDQLDGRADLFSVGAMMHALITGHRINNGRTEQEALVMAATKPVPSVARIAPNLPIEVIQIIDKSLAWDRRSRYADAREMQGALQAALASLGAAPVTAPARMPQSSRPDAGPQPDLPPARLPTLDPHLSPAAVAPPPLIAAPVPAQAREPARRPTPEWKEQSVRHGTGPLAPAAAAAHRPAAAPQRAEPVAADNDPRILLTRDLLKHVDRLLPSVRQFGWQHPATERTLRTAFEAFAEALAKDPNQFTFTLRPYSMMMQGQIVWEPGPPFDSIPYNLFACGIRALRIEPGVTQQEVKDLLSLMMLDPVRDLPPEDDIAAAFWEKGLAHVHYQSVDAFAEGDAAEREAFYNETDEIEALAEQGARQHANRVEAKAMAISTDRSAQLRAVHGPSPMALDDVVKAAFVPQLSIPSERWSERYVDALVEGYLDAAVNRDAPLVLASLRKSAADLVVAGRMAIVIQLHDAVNERLAQRVGGNDLARLQSALTNALFGAETLELTLKQLREQPEFVPTFIPILAVMSPNELPAMLNALRDSPPKAVRDAIVTFVERVLAGRENEVATAAVGLDADTSSAVLSVIARANTPAARQVIQGLMQSEDVNLRIEAKVLAAPTPEHAQNELMQMLDHASALVRMGALRAISRYKLRNAWATVSRMVKAANFNELGMDERRELIRALIVLVPERGEPAALEIAKKGGIIVSEEREATRLACIETLGDVSRSGTTAAALREIAQARLGTSEDTRHAAAAAARAIVERGEVAS